ncbi:hypothetical protein RQN30_00305 [Arcanobacterium hippocoleae]
MRITAICNPLSCLQSAEVAEIFAQQWLQARSVQVQTNENKAAGDSGKLAVNAEHTAADAVKTFLFSQGRFSDGGGTGLRAALAHNCSDADDDYLLIDLAELSAWNGGAQAPVGSSAAVGMLLRRALHANKRQIHIHLPRFSQYSDLGLGLLLAFNNLQTADLGGSDLYFWNKVN